MGAADTDGLWIQHFEAKDPRVAHPAIDMPARFKRAYMQRISPPDPRFINVESYPYSALLAGGLQAFPGGFHNEAVTAQVPGRENVQSQISEPRKFDALVLGLLLIAQVKGQLVIPVWVLRSGCPCQFDRGRKADRGSEYTRGTLALLRQNKLLVPDKVASGAIVNDVEELAQYEGLAPGSNGFMDFVTKATA
jgi:hypothetical protein